MNEEQKTINDFLHYLDVRGYNYWIIQAIRKMLLKAKPQTKWVPTDVAGEYQEVPLGHREAEND